MTYTCPACHTIYAEFTDVFSHLARYPYHIRYGGRGILVLVDSRLVEFTTAMILADVNDA